MSEFESAGESVLQGLRKMNENFKSKMIRSAIFYRWKDIAGPFADDIFPIKVVGNTLILYSKTSAAKDNFKYIAKDILDAANFIIGGGEEIFKKIDFAKSFSRPSAKTKNFSKGKKISAQKKFPVDDVELSDAELAECEKNVAEIKNPALKEIALKNYITQKKVNKIKLASGWHKCSCCDVLCPKEEIICESCRITERSKMRRAIQQYFLQNPSANFFEVTKEIKKLFPHISEEISVEIVSSERSALISSTASKISFGDTKSDAVKLLVQLYRQIPQEKLTDAVINRALKELRFNLSNLPPFQEK